MKHYPLALSSVQSLVFTGLAKHAYPLHKKVDAKHPLVKFTRISITGFNDLSKMSLGNIRKIVETTVQKGGNVLLCCEGKPE